MQNEIVLRERALNLIEGLREALVSPGLCARHRRAASDFTRERVLNLPVLMLWLLQKSLKSLQARTQEFFWQLHGAALPSVTASALTHARAKLKATAFVELNQKVLQTVYGPTHAAVLRRWKGHRLLAVDSSLVRLPSHASVGETFGWVQCANHRGALERYPQGRISILYDVLNQVAIDARLVSGRIAETQLAYEQLVGVKAGDVVLSDRGYTGYAWLAAMQAKGVHFVARASRGSFAAVQQLFVRNQAGVSVPVKLRAPRAAQGHCREQGWPLELTVRLVTIRLKSGELEVLVSSLLEEAIYSTQELGAVYWQRWGEETYYGRLKGRLDLEHCSGQTVEAVEQDFQATILLSNVESVIIGPAQAQLAERTAHRTQPVQINRAVSIHALKHQLIELLSSRSPAEEVLAQLVQWFQANPVSVRPQRDVPRRKFSPSRSYHYQRRVRKIVF